MPSGRLGVLRIAVLAVLVAGLDACHPVPQPANTVAAPPLATQVVEPVEARREQVWDGVVEAVDETTIAAQTNARVEALPVDVGDRVSKGDVLVRFTDVEQVSGQRAAAANVASARAAYLDAEGNWTRIQTIFARGLVARAQLDNATATRDAARAALNAAEQALRSAGQQTDYTVVRAPFDGVITRRFVHVGEAVQSGPPTPQPLLAMASLSALRVDVVVPQSTIAAIREFDSTTVLPAVGDSERIRASDVTVFPYADPLSHTFRVRVELPSGTRGLYPGMTVKVAFSAGGTTRLLIPVSTVVERGELSGVYVVGSDVSVTLRQLRLGHRYGDQVAVLAGLSRGERIALDPGAATAYVSRLHANGKAPP